MNPRPSLFCHRASQNMLELAEQVLDISNRNIQLATQILLQGSQNVEDLLMRQAENTTRIQTLLQKIREQADSASEKELLDATSIRWSSAHAYEQFRHDLTKRKEPIEAGTAVAKVILPLFLDHNSWSAFVHYLRVQSERNLRGEQEKKEAARRAREFVRANQELKSKIAERKRIEESLSQLGSIINSSTDAIVIHTLDGTIVSWNAGAETVYGYSAGEAVGQPRNILVPPEQSEDFARIVEMLKRGEKIQPHETVHMRKDGKRVNVSAAISPVKDAEGKIVGAAAITRDISDRKKAEERFYKAFNANPEPITIATLRDGHFIDVNESFLRVTGCRRGEVIGRTSLELRFWERAEDRSELVKALEKHGSVRDCEITFLTKSGEQRIGLNSAEIIELGGEKCIISMFRDMTEQKTLEKQLRKAQRMEAIGQLSGGIAHDFNNLLTVMIGHSELLEQRVARSDPSFRSIEEIKKAGMNAASLTRQLLAFSRQQVLEPKVLELNAVIRDLEKMLRRLIGENIELSADLDPELSRIKADEGQIQQVILNLVVNARDAMPDGGRLRIKTANVTLDENYARLHPPQAPGEYALLEISDTGTGMDAETQGHIFEPFFTTKAVGKGTGLGLSTVYGVIKQSGGYIWVDSRPGQGATFRIYLPRTAETTVPQKFAPTAPESLRGTETILLVEDADQVREVVREWLISSGYTVLEAGSPDDAMRVEQQYGLPICLLLSDVIMPGMNGPALGEKITRKRPNIKLLYMSGYLGFLDQGATGSDVSILPKPLTREVLLRKVRQVLTSQAVLVAT